MVKGSLPSMNSITHHSHFLPVGSCNEKTTLKISRLENYHPRNRKHHSGKRNHPGNTKHHLGKEKNTPPNYNIQLPNFTKLHKFPEVSFLLTLWLSKFQLPLLAHRSNHIMSNNHKSSREDQTIQTYQTVQLPTLDWFSESIPPHLHGKIAKMLGAFCGCKPHWITKSLPHRQQLIEGLLVKTGCEYRIPSMMRLLPTTWFDKMPKNNLHGWSASATWTCFFQRKTTTCLSPCPPKKTITSHLL